MEVTVALDCLSSLAQPTRLAAFRLLLSKEPQGLPAGEVARSLEVPQNTMSSHLGHLAHAGLVRSERHSRSIVDRADVSQFQDLIAFLLLNCCGGLPEMCSTVLVGLEPLSRMKIKPKGCSCDG